MAHITHNNDPEAGAAPSTQQDQGGGGRNNVAKDLTLYEFKEQLLLLSTLVTTVTYVAGLNLPGGSWEQDDPGGHIAGDPILRDIHYHRYLAFYYCNAAALAASVVVSLILIILQKNDHVWTSVLRVVMMLDLLSLMGSYGAGSCRDAFTTIFAVVAFSVLVLCIIGVFFSYLWLNGDKEALSNPISNSNSNCESNSNSVSLSHSISHSDFNSNSLSISHSNSNPDSTSNSISNSNSNTISNPNSSSIPINNSLSIQNKVMKSLITDSKKRKKDQIDVLMLLATFSITISYVAGLSPPGGFWSSTKDGHHLSDPVLQARRRFRAFYICNTTSFVVSLLIIVVLLEKMMLGEKVLLGRLTWWFGRKKLMGAIPMRLPLAYGVIAFALLGLMGAYAAGSCRGAGSTLLVLTIPVCVFLQLALVFLQGQYLILDPLRRFKALFKHWVGTPGGSNRFIHHHQIARNFATLLAIFVVTITYQAGLDPPGGLWQEDRDGHKMGHPVLQTTHPTRYKVFFYSNSTAFVTSMLVILILHSKFLLTRRIVESTIGLDLLCLVTAYGAGSTRDVNTSIHILALEGLLLIYVIAHMTYKDPGPEPEGYDAVKDLHDKRRMLLLIAILVTTLTYQAGLTPPGGFWLADDQGLGRRVGFPVLLNNYPRRYNIFFYCNAASFMASVTLILFLISPKLYSLAIRCYVLYVCMLVGMVGLMGAYAAGSSRHLKTSIYVLTLVVPVLAFIALLVTLFWFFSKLGHGSNGTTNNNDDKNNTTTTTAIPTTTTTITAMSTTTTTYIANDENNNKEKHTLEYLMLLGILGASMTYQTGLKPPGGLWQDNNNGHSAGNPILHDINKHRYNAFFYSNSTSFMASIMVVVMLLPLTFKYKFGNHNLPLWPMHTAILLDMLSLLVAYAAGTTREWETSRNVIFLIIPVLLYIALYATASVFFHRKDHVLTMPTPTLAQVPEWTTTPHQDAE
ncbi:uncharacterized protein [Aegilops tauschii subsp. strangulata]|uniref:PGG domain-containing protein n=1 Tax=Aegilops tauschii TaxID=37682 RepID=R7VYV5_AEGTA